MSDAYNRTDNLSPAQRKHTMAQVHSKDTRPELIVRRLVHGLGYRYRLHRKDLPGNPDLVFVGRRKVIFVHGCFWHGHNCRSGIKRPKTNQDYWLKKLQRNKTRDLQNQSKLAELGWDVLVVWECEIGNQNELADRFIHFLDVEVC
jgi:DNA mismatch endonuclease (patch repair protein)